MNTFLGRHLVPKKHFTLHLISFEISIFAKVKSKYIQITHTYINLSEYNMCDIATTEDVIKRLQKLSN